MTSTSKPLDLVICSGKLSNLVRLRDSKSAAPGSVAPPAPTGNSVSPQGATPPLISDGGKPKRTRINTKVRIDFVVALVNKTPEKQFRMHELVEAMPPNIRGRDIEETLRVLRKHLPLSKEITVIRSKRFMFVQSLQQQTHSIEKDPYAAPPLNMNWLQFGYLCGLVHLDIHDRNDVLPTIKKLYEKMMKIAEEAYK